MPASIAPVGADEPVENQPDTRIKHSHASVSGS